MAECKYCGEAAGLMRRQHTECRQKHDEAIRRIPVAIAKWLESDKPPTGLRQAAHKFAKANYVSETELRSLTAQGFGYVIDHILDDHLLTDEEEKKFSSLLDEFEFATNDLAPADAHRLIKAAILKDLENGSVPKRIRIDGDLPLNLAREEAPIWVFQNATYFLTRSKTTYQGGSHGVSVRVAKGVYLRSSAFRGEPVRTEYLSEEGTGLFAVTNRAVYFYSPSKSFKIVPKKIMAVETFSDGISITPDGVSPKPRIVLLDDPWFAANVIMRLNNL